MVIARLLKYKEMGVLFLKKEISTENTMGKSSTVRQKNNPNQDPVNVTTTITVFYPPEINKSPGNTTVTEGDVITLKCQATANPPANITWSRGKKVPINPGHTTQSGALTIPDAVKSDAGKYICTAMNGYNGKNHQLKAHAYVVINYPPSIVNKSDDQVVNESGTVTLMCKADGEPVPTITWTKSPGAIAPPHTGNGGTFTISSVKKTDAGIYTCTASNGIGIRTAHIKVTVQYKPTIDRASSNTSGYSWKANKIKLRCKSSSALPSPTWTWYKPSGAHIISGTQSITNGSEVTVETGPASGDYGNYTCNATNVAGSDVHSINVIQLYPPGRPNVTVTEIEAVSAKVQWTEPEDNGGSKVTGYKLEINSNTHYFDLPKLHYEVTGLAIYTQYEAKLSAKNIVGFGNASSMTFKTKKQGPPASPVIKNVEVHQTSVTLYWTKPDDNGGKIKQYSIYKQVDDKKSSWSQAGTLNGETLIITVKNLEPGTTYRFVVTAHNRFGESVKEKNKTKIVSIPIKTTSAPTTSPVEPSKGKSSGDSSDTNQTIIIIGAVVAVILIIITAVISIIILRKKNVFGKRKSSSSHSAAYHNDVDSNDSLGRGAAVINLNDDSIPTYAAVDMSKKKKKEQNAIPNYAAVDKSKKKRPGEIIYADLADFNTNDVPAAPRPVPTYTSTDYADISQFQNQNEPEEPTYANFPGRSKDYNI